MPKAKFLSNERIPIGGGRFLRYNHAPGGPNFSRANDNQVMLISNHDSSIEKILGTVRNAHSDGSFSHAEFDLLEIDDDPAIKRADALIKNGMKGLSAGILVHKAHLAGNTLEVDEWELVELSLTPVPRDASTSIENSFVIRNEGGSDFLDRFWEKNENLPDPKKDEEEPSEETVNNEPEVDGIPLSVLVGLLESRNSAIINKVKEVAEAALTA